MSPVPRLPRSPILLPSREAERALFESLEVTATDYMKADDFGRQAAREALRACLKFLHDRGLSGQALKALADVIRALDDVDRGVLPEIFDPQAGERAGAEGTNAMPPPALVPLCIKTLQRTKRLPRSPVQLRTGRNSGPV
jgi:hypothetical protein